MAAVARMDRDQPVAEEAEHPADVAAGEDIVTPQRAGRGVAEDPPQLARVFLRVGPIVMRRARLAVTAPITALK